MSTAAVSGVQPANLLDWLQDCDSINVEGSRFYNLEQGLFPSITSIIAADPEKEEKMNFFWENRIHREILGEMLGLGEAVPYKTFFEDISFRNENKDLIESTEPLIPERKAIEKKYTAERGEKTHTLIEQFLLKGELPKEDDYSIESTLFSLMKPELENISNIKCIEQTLASFTLRVAGRVDAIANFNDILSVIDFKVSSKLKRKEDRESWFIQTCFYALAYEELVGERIDQLVIINGREDNKCSVYIEKTENWRPLLYMAIANYLIREKEKENADNV